MGKCPDLLDAARRAPLGVKFADLCKLAECYGWEFKRQRGSHRLYKRTGVMNMMSFQESKNGMAKPYQMRQLIDAIDQLG
jgi:hypothetical protein